MHDPDSYEALKSNVVIAAAELFPILVSNMRWSNSELILDYGCGGGSTTSDHIVPLAEKYMSTITAVDISGTMIDYAKKSFPSPLITYSVADIMDSDGWNCQIGVKFDKIFAFYVLHWIKNYPETMKKFFTILHPSGYVGAAVITKSPHFHLIKAVEKSEEWGIYARDYDLYLPDWLEAGDAKQRLGNSLESFGFEIVHLTEREMAYPNFSFKTVSELLTSISPFVHRIPKERLQEFGKFAGQFLRTYWGLEEGQETFDYSYDVVSFVARKPVVHTLREG